MCQECGAIEVERDRLDGRTDEESFTARLAHVLQPLVLRLFRGRGSTRKMGLMASQGTGMMELFESPAKLSNRTEQAGTCSQRLEGEERTVSFAKNLAKSTLK